VEDIVAWTPKEKEFIFANIISFPFSNTFDKPGSDTGLFELEKHTFNTFFVKVFVKVNH
jgi:hypothetical protein